MHALIIVFKNETIEVFGPFPTYFLANEYALVVAKHHSQYKGHNIKEMVIPDNILQQVIWK